MTVFNDSKLPNPLKVQLLDEAGNPSKTADIKVQIAKDPKLKVWLARSYLDFQFLYLGVYVHRFGCLFYFNL